MKRGFVVVAMTLAVGFAAPASSQGLGGTLNFARYEGSKLTNPIYADRNPDIWMVGSIFDTLLRPSADGNSVVEGLAESHTVSDDGKVVVLTLREDLKFSDGTALIGDDVIFSLDRARNPDLSPWAGLLGSIDSLTTDGRNISISLSHPDPTIRSMLATFNTATAVYSACEDA